jgi:hypothetical protein
MVDDPINVAMWSPLGQSDARLAHPHRPPRRARRVNMRVMGLQP